jgi:hypothetical protein
MRAASAVERYSNESKTEIEMRPLARFKSGWVSTRLKVEPRTKIHKLLNICPVKKC